MRTQYNYIEFTFVDSGDHKKGGACLNKKSGTILGYWEYYPSWRQYVIEFLGDCVFNSSCLRDVAQFLEQLNKKPKPKETPKHSCRPTHYGLNGM